MANKKHMRHCSLCHNEYEYCPVCGEDKDKEAWHIMWDTANCMQIDEILSNWGAKVIDSETAAALLKSKDVSRKENWNSSFRAAYNQIMKDVASKVDKQEETPHEESPKAEETPAPHEPLSVSEELKQHAAVGETKKIKVQPKSRVVATTKKSVVEKG